jgi:tetratricopeptide (TPR) repeat protein
MDAIDELRRRTVGAIGFRFDPRTSRMVTNAVRPPSYEAYQAFAVGIEHRSRIQWRPAVAYFRQAIALDSTFTMALFTAALDHTNLREWAQADSLIGILARSRERLPTLERQLLAWAEARVRGDLPGALEAARGLVPFSQDLVPPQVALDALQAARPEEAVAVFEEIAIDRHPSPMWQLVLGRRLTDAYHILGDYQSELEEAKRATERHPGFVEPVLWEVRALTALGRVSDARERLDEAPPEPAESWWPPGRIMVRAADEFRVHGHASAARDILLRALAWYRSLPDSQAVLEGHRRHRAAALLRADSLDSAEAAFRALATEFPEDPYYIASVGVALALRRQTKLASEIAATALDRNPPYDHGHHLYERARIAAQIGNADDAIMLLRRAFANGFRFAFVGGISGTASAPDGSPHLDPVFDTIRSHPSFLELFRGKS